MIRTRCMALRGDPMPWDIVKSIYESRTGEIVPIHSLRAYGSAAMRKVAEALQDDALLLEAFGIKEQRP